MYGIVAYTFLNVREKIHKLLSSIKKMHAKENWFLFLPHGVHRVSKNTPPFHYFLYNSVINKPILIGLVVGTQNLEDI